MALSTIRAYLKTLLEGVSGIGKVYDYKRYSNDWASYRLLFVTNSKVNEWEVQREGFEVNTTGAVSGLGKVKDTEHELVIRGFYAFQDIPSSEKEFDTLVDLITDEINDDPTLGGTCEIVHVPIKGTINYGFLGQVMCHIIEIKMVIKERTFL